MSQNEKGAHRKRCAPMENTHTQKDVSFRPGIDTKCRGFDNRRPNQNYLPSSWEWPNEMKSCRRPSIKRFDDDRPAHLHGAIRASV